MGTTSSGLSTARPAATGSGNTYLCKDIPAFYFDDPNTSTWRQGDSEYLPAPPSVSSYTPVGSPTSLTLVQLADTIRAVVTGNNVGLNMACALISSSSLGATAGWSVTLVASFNTLTSGQYPTIGVCVSNGIVAGTSEAWGMMLRQVGGTLNAEQAAFGVGKNGTVGYTSSSFSQETGIPYKSGSTNRLHLRLVNDGSVLHYQLGSDGYHWNDWWSAASPSGLLYYGFALGCGPVASGWGQALIQSQVLNPSITQYSVSNVTVSGGLPTLTIGTHALQPGDLVAIHGIGGSTGVNTGSGTGTTAGAGIIGAATGTTITISGFSSGGTYTSGGTVTLISR